MSIEGKLLSDGIGLIVLAGGLVLGLLLGAVAALAFGLVQIAC